MEISVLLLLNRAYVAVRTRNLHVRWYQQQCTITSCTAFNGVTHYKSNIPGAANYPHAFGLAIIASPLKHVAQHCSFQELSEYLLHPTWNSMSHHLHCQHGPLILSTVSPSAFCTVNQGQRNVQSCLIQPIVVPGGDCTSISWRQQKQHQATHR